MARRLGSLAASSGVPMLSEAPTKRRAEKQRLLELEVNGPEVHADTPEIHLSAGMSLRQIMETDDVEDDPGEVAFERWVQVYELDKEMFQVDSSFLEMKMRELTSSDLSKEQAHEFTTATAFAMLNRMMEVEPQYTLFLTMARNELVKAVYSDWSILEQNYRYISGAPFFSVASHPGMMGLASAGPNTPMAMGGSFRLRRGGQFEGRSATSALVPINMRHGVIGAVDRIIRVWQEHAQSLIFHQWVAITKWQKDGKRHVNETIKTWMRYRGHMDTRSAFQKWKIFIQEARERGRANAVNSFLIAADAKVDDGSVTIAQVKAHGVYQQMERSFKATEVQLKVMTDKVKRLQELLFDEKAMTAKRQVELDKLIEVERQATVLANAPKANPSPFKLEFTKGTEFDGWNDWLEWLGMGDKEFLMKFVHECIDRGDDDDIKKPENWTTDFEDSMALCMVLTVGAGIKIDVKKFQSFQRWERAAEIVVMLQEAEIIDLITPENIVSGAGEVLMCVIADLFVKYYPLLDPVVGGPGVVSQNYVSSTRLLAMQKPNWATANKSLRTMAEAVRSHAARTKRFLWRTLRLRAGAKHVPPATEVNAAFYQTRIATIRDLVATRQSMRVDKFGTRLMSVEQLETAELAKIDLDAVLRSFGDDLTKLYDHYSSRDIGNYGADGVSSLGFRYLVLECELNHEANSVTIDELMDFAVQAMTGMGSKATLTPATFVDTLLRASLVLHPPHDPNPQLCTLAIGLSKTIALDILPRYNGRQPVSPFIATAFSGECRRVVQDHLVGFRAIFTSCKSAKDNIGHGKVAIDFADRRSVCLPKIIRDLGVDVDDGMDEFLVELSARCGIASSGSSKAVVMSFAGFVEAMVAATTLLHPSPFMPLHAKVSSLTSLFPNPTSDSKRDAESIATDSDD